jgi:hypothetical protein
MDKSTENQIKGDIKAEVKLLTSKEGGLKEPLTRQKVGSIFACENDSFSCFLILANDQQVFPGEKAVLSIKFVYPELIKPKLRVGDIFKLRDYRVFATGKVLEVV